MFAYAFIICSTTFFIEFLRGHVHLSSKISDSQNSITLHKTKFLDIFSSSCYYCIPLLSKMEVFLEPDFSKIQFWSDVIGCFCGVLVTAFLIWTIFHATDNKFREYSHLILISAVFDLFLAVVQLCTQHQIVFINGILYIMPESPVERKVFEHFGSVLVFFHVFTTFYGLLILPVQFHHRFVLLKNGHASLKKLVLNLALTASVGFFMASLVFLSTKKSLERGRDHYLELIPKSPFYQLVADEFLYVNDPVDWETGIFFGGLFYLNLLAYIVVLFYTYKSWRQVHSVENLSMKSRSMQRQYSFCLLMMTFNTTVFAFIPMSLPALTLRICNNSFASGFLTMVLFSWLPFANSTSTFFIITNYRRYLVSVICPSSLLCKRGKVEAKSSGSVQTPSIETIVKA